METEWLTLKQAAATLPHRPNIATVWRWVVNGVQGVRLEARRFGSKTFTTRAWLDEFARRLVEAGPIRGRGRKPSNQKRRSPQAREAAIKHADAQLRAMGV